MSYKLYSYFYFLICSDPGEVAVCFGDEGTCCPLYKHDIDGKIHQTYSDGEETVSSFASDDVQQLNIDNNKHNTSSPPKDMNTFIPIIHDYNHVRSDIYSSQTLSNVWYMQLNKL